MAQGKGSRGKFTIFKVGNEVLCGPLFFSLEYKPENQILIQILLLSLFY